MPYESDELGARAILEDAYSRMTEVRDMLQLMIEVNEASRRMVRYAADGMMPSTGEEAV